MDMTDLPEIAAPNLRQKRARLKRYEHMGRHLALLDELREVLKELAKPYTYRFLADQMGCSHQNVEQTIGYMKRGRKVGFARLVAVADALGYDVHISLRPRKSNGSRPPS
jgi:FixJ family two-component response regulator